MSTLCKIMHSGFDWDHRCLCPTQLLQSLLFRRKTIDCVRPEIESQVLTQVCIAMCHQIHGTAILRSWSVTLESRVWACILFEFKFHTSLQRSIIAISIRVDADLCIGLALFSTFTNSKNWQARHQSVVSFRFKSPNGGSAGNKPQSVW